MSKIEIGRWSEQLRRMLGQKGTESVAGELSPEVSPTIQLEGPTAEWAFLKGVRLSGAGTNVTAAVGNVSSARLLNPAGSGCIAVVDQVYLSSLSAQRMSIRLGQTVNVAIGGVLATSVRDSRWGAAGGAGRNVLSLSSTNSGGALSGNTLLQRSVLANAGLTYRVPVVLMPGDNLDVSGISTNVSIQVGLSWTERGLPLLELG